MPSYTIQCVNPDCEDYEKKKDIVKKMSEEFPQCQNCGKNVQNVLTPAPVSMKGSGWFGKAKVGR